MRLGLFSLAPFPSIPAQDEARDVPCHAVLSRAMLSHAVPCHAVPHSGTHVPHTLSSAVNTSSASARSLTEHLPGPSSPHSLVPVRHWGPGRILLAGPCIMHCLFFSTFPVCNSIRQTAVLLIQWCLIFDFLKYRKWMRRQCAGDPLYMSSNIYLNI